MFCIGFYLCVFALTVHARVNTWSQHNPIFCKSFFSHPRFSIPFRFRCGQQARTAYADNEYYEKKAVKRFMDDQRFEPRELCQSKKSSRSGARFSLINVLFFHFASNGRRRCQTIKLNAEIQQKRLKKTKQVHSMGIETATRRVFIRWWQRLQLPTDLLGKQHSFCIKYTFCVLPFSAGRICISGPGPRVRPFEFGDFWRIRVLHVLRWI